MGTVLRKIKSQSGQVTVEYLMLLALSFGVTFLMIQRPITDFTLNLIAGIRNGIGNAVKHSEFEGGDITPNDPRHPSNPDRLKPLHL